MLVKRLAAGRDKRAVLLTIYGVGGAALIVNKFISPDNMGELIVFVVLAVIAVTMYWQFMPAIVYDVCEYDELETGKQRQGAIVSLLSLVEAFAAGLGSQLLGIILQFAGFDGEAAVQTDTALLWIENCLTIVPVIFLALAWFSLKKYPITKERFAEIQRQLTERKANKQE
jgi:GPH family glycoside/pentoside/hexuronide:cation symporter